MCSASSPSPSEAITFGNVAEASTDTVKAWKKNSRSYELIGYLSVRARTTYLARLRNPNPALAEKTEKRG